MRGLSIVIARMAAVFFCIGATIAMAGARRTCIQVLSETLVDARWTISSPQPY
jgi:hypothetical protein